MQSIRFLLVYSSLLLLLALSIASLQSYADTNDNADVVFEEKKEELVSESRLPGTTPASPLTRPPTVLNVRTYIRQLMPEAQITTFLRVFNIDEAEGINDLFMRFREYDAKIKDAEKSSRARLIEDIYAQPSFRNTFGVQKISGTYFDVIGPRRIGRVEEGRRRIINMKDDLEAICAAADAALKDIIEAAVMAPFMSWADTRARIYVVTEPKIWQQLNARGVLGTPAETALAVPEHREFFLFFTQGSHDYADQAIAYVVAETALDEYTRVISGNPQAQLPLFFRTGMAAEAANLEAILTQEEPVQVREVTLLHRVTPVRRPNRGTLLPLAERRLITLEDLVEMNDFPANTEMRYYFLRQSRALVHDLRDEATLAFATLLRSLTGPTDFQRQIGAAYMDMQRDLEAREVARYSRGHEQRRPLTGQAKFEADWQRFVQFTEFKKTFRSMTQEHISEEFRQRREEAQRERAEKAAREEREKVFDDPEMKDTDNDE